MHQEGAREEGRRRGAHGEVSAILSNTGYCLASESMSGGSGSSKNVERSRGVYFSPVNVKAPEVLTVVVLSTFAFPGLNHPLRSADHEQSHLLPVPSLSTGSRFPSIRGLSTQML